jgi:type II secretory pathway component GspD/PulD (secretin)
VSDVARFDNIRGLDLPVVSTRSQTGRVTLPNGQMLVIGGLTSRVVRKSERRVPVLGRIPVVGIPFRSRTSEAQIKGLIIFVRPTIVDLRELSPRAESAMAFWRKQSAEWKNRTAIEQEIASLQDG